MAIYQFNSKRERVTSHPNLLEAEEMTGISGKRILTAMKSGAFCDGRWYFSRQPFMDILFSGSDDTRKDADGTEKTNIRCNFGISHSMNDRVNAVIEDWEDRSSFFRKAVEAYVEKLEAERNNS